MKKLSIIIIWGIIVLLNSQTYLYAGNENNHRKELHEFVGKSAQSAPWPRRLNPVHIVVVFTKFKGESPGDSLAPSWADALFDDTIGSIPDFFSSISFGKYIRKHLRSKNSIVFIAEVNGNPVGYNINAIKDNIPVFKVEKLGHFFEIFVRKEFRCMKISSKFKDLAFKWFRKNGIKHISMFVNKENKQAHSIYKKWGFYDFNIEMRRKI